MADNALGGGTKVRLLLQAVSRISTCNNLMG